jgi:phosphate transport system protein
MVDELRKSFHDELEVVRQGIVRMAGRVSESIPRGTEAFLDSDLAAAQKLIEEDDILDSMAVGLEEKIYEIIALQAPVAKDLRSVTTALWLTSEIERSGDLMVNIAKATRRVFGTPFDARVRGLLVQMSEEAARLFRLAIDSFIERDSGLAAALDDIDDRLDQLNLETVQAIFEAHEHHSIKLSSSVQLALVCRYYERIGDHAVNIGERVRYMVDGWLPEHTGALRATARGALETDG